MSCFDELFNQEVKKLANFKSKFTPNIKNSYYAIAARKRKRDESLLIRVYSASSMSSGNSLLGSFAEGLITYLFKFLTNILLL